MPIQLKNIEYLIKSRIMYDPNNSKLLRIFVEEKYHFFSFDYFCTSFSFNLTAFDFWFRLVGYLNFRLLQLYVAVAFTFFLGFAARFFDFITSVFSSSSYNSDRITSSLFSGSSYSADIFVSLCGTYLRYMALFLITYYKSWIKKKGKWVDRQ